MKRTADDGSTPLVARDLVYQVEAARLLDRVTLNAGRGEFIGLIGPNGAGKTTLLRAISGLLRRDEGSVALEGRDLDRMSAKEVARILAHVPQIAPYTYGFTSLELVLMGRYPHMGPLQIEGPGEIHIALEAMRLTETESFTDRSVTTLSGGERQRVFVARALAQQPHLLLLDEPTSNLDIQHQLKVLQIVRDLVAKGLTAIAAIHDLPLAARYCHRLLLLSHGHLVAEGTPEAVLTPPNIEATFGVCTVVYPDPLTGSLTLSLLDSSSPQGRPRGGTRVHVVCGGGRGARLMYELQRAGFTVTAGALGAGDTDRVAADILGIEYVPVAAFGAIPEEAHARHKELVASSDWAILCDMPIGTNNLCNLEALAAAKRLICVDTVPFTHRDYTGGVAQRFFDTLHPVLRCTTPVEAIAAILREANAALHASVHHAGQAPTVGGAVEEVKE